MKWEILHKPAYSLLKVILNSGESVKAEPGSFVMYKGDIEIKTKTGGILKGALRKVLAGESLFLNEFISHSDNSEVYFAPVMPGDVEYIELDGDEYLISDGSYLCSWGDVDIGIGWKGFSGFFMKGGLIWLKVAGEGGVWINAYGALEKVELPPGHRVIIDNTHFVAVNSTVKHRIRTFGGLKSTIFGGEGWVIEVEGPGTVFVQTRNIPGFLEIVKEFVKKKFKI